MTFTTLTFILFLVCVFALYWAVRHRAIQNTLLIFVSYCFYGWWDYRFCALLAISSLCDFCIGLGMDRVRSRRFRGAMLVSSVLVNLSMLGFFKYFNFFVNNFVALSESLGWQVHPRTIQIVLPVGISFYTFQTLSYTIDVYKGKIKPTRRFIDYCAFVCFFPQLVAGPIERAKNLLPQFINPRRFNYEKAVDGSRQILWGFAKKMILADNLGIVVDQIYRTSDVASGPELALATICFAFQIYCDFSAYSDIAIGTARLFGFSLMRNFAYPYFSQSVGEFWRRWHISLSTWFRDYVYIPLGGNQVGNCRRAWNLLTTFVISGLWHGPSWNFVMWGGLNGAAMMPGVAGQTRARIGASDVPAGSGRFPSVPVLLRMIRTFFLICVFWVFFRTDSLHEAMVILKKFVIDSANPAAYRALISQVIAEKSLFAMLSLFVVVEWLQRGHAHALVLNGVRRSLRWFAYTFLLWYALYRNPPEESPFIYFQF